jgi:protein-tyrosine-phosphatase
MKKQNFFRGEKNQKMYAQANMARLKELQTAEHITEGPKAGPQSTNELEGLHNLLREDASEVVKAASSGAQGHPQNPTDEQSREEAQLDRNDHTEQNYNNLPNPLGDYSNLVKQMKQGSSSAFLPSYIMSGLDSRRAIDKLTDVSGDGYNLIANRFINQESQAKKIKKVLKNPKMSSQVPYY